MKNNSFIEITTSCDQIPYREVCKVIQDKANSLKVLSGCNIVISIGVKKALQPKKNLNKTQKKISPGILANIETLTADKKNLIIFLKTLTKTDLKLVGQTIGISLSGIKDYNNKVEYLADFINMPHRFKEIVSANK